MKIHHLLLLCVTCFVSLFTEAHAKLPVRQANIEKLLDPETRIAEVIRLDADKKKKRNFYIAEVRVITCPQKAGEPIYALMVRNGRLTKNYVPSYIMRDSDAYPAEETKSLFKDEQADPKIISKNLTNSELIEDTAISFFKADGTEIHPFGGNNYISRGYLYDFNKDGILERIEHTNWGIEDNHNVQSLAVQTIEDNPKTLLHVVYNWHPNDANKSDQWDYSMKDVNNDGFNDVVFGLKKQMYTISYLWDVNKKDFIGPDGKKGDHFRRLKKAGYLEVKEMGKLNYKLNKFRKKNEPIISPVTREEVLARELHPLPDFKSMSMEKTLAFFAPGKTHQADFDRRQPTVIPNELSSLTPKLAALSYARANRNDTQRKNYLLKIDDRNGIAPPKKGWIVFKEQSASCYTFVKWHWAINFENNILLYFTNSSNGFVFRNPLVDATGYQIRMIKLTPDETTHLSGTLWWLNRIRSIEIRSERNSSGASMSSADGRCSFYQTSDAQNTVHFHNVSRWNSSGVKQNWNEEYNKTVCGNLASEYCMTYLPKYLGERWSNYSELEHHNLFKNDDQKLEERHDNDELKTLKKTITEIFQLNKNTRVPGELMKETAKIIGDLGLKEFKKDLQLLKSQVIEPIPLETEFLALKQELKGKNGSDYYFADKGTEKEKILKKFSKLDTLKSQLEINYHWNLKQGLDTQLEQLELVDDLAKLSELAESEKPQAFWAQRQMRKHYPDEYRTSLFNIAITSENPLKQEQAIELYLTLYPDHSGKLIHALKPEEQLKHCLSLFPAFKTHHPEHLDEVLEWIMSKALNPETRWEHRHHAVTLLTPKNFPSHEEKIYPLLMKIASEPSIEQKVYNPHPLSQCIESLVKWKEARKHWKDILKLAEPRKGDEWNIGAIQGDLISLSKHCGAEARAAMVGLLEKKLLNGAGFMEGRIHTILKNDYRECLPVIERLATLSPQEEQHEKATSSQSTFPLGRHSYHAARHVRALWGEHDDKTKAKLWAAMGYHHPEIFLEASANQNGKAKYKLNTAGKILLTHIDKDEATKQDFLARVKESDVYYQEYAKALGEVIEQSK